MMMSSLNPHTEEIKRLQVEVERAKIHLAEVVDECVFVEGEKARVEQQIAESIHLRDVEELLRLVEMLSMYALSLEQHVIAPALGSLDDGFKQFTTSRQEALATAERLATESTATSSLSPLMSRVFSSLRQGPNFAAATLRRQQICTGPSLTSLEDAYVMCVGMLAAKQQLHANITDIQRTWDSCASKMKLGAATVSASSAAALATANQNLTASKAQVASMAESIRLLEDAARGASNSSGDVVRVTQRLRELEQLVVQHEAERGEVAQRFATIQAALDSSGKLPADVVPRSTHELAVLQLQHQSKALQQAQEDLAASRKELSSARKEWDDERRLLEATAESLRAQLAEKQKGASVDDMDSFIRSLQRPPGSSGGNTHNSVGGQFLGINQQEQQLGAAQYHTKIRAFEMTISALNSELALLEEKIIAIERRSEDEKRDAASLLAQVTKKNREELEECEVVVQRLTAELEGLIHENGELKQKLRNIYSLPR